MFGLFSKKPKIKEEVFEFSSLHTDMHSHILPNIDDGADSLETSLVLIKGMQALGYKKMIATPHIMWDMYQNTPDIINRQLEIVQKALQKEGIAMEIHAAAEYFLDDHVEGLLQKKEKLLTVSENKVLVEFSLAYPAFNIKEVLFEMQMQGYQPVLAHPERYIYLEGNKDFYSELQEAGCLFQLNLLSLSGHYGKSVTDLAQYLLKNNFYSLVGTDMHSVRHLDELSSPYLGGLLKKHLNLPQLGNSQL